MRINTIGYSAKRGLSERVLKERSLLDEQRNNGKHILSRYQGIHSAFEVIRVLVFHLAMIFHIFLHEN